MKRFVAMAKLRLQGIIRAVRRFPFTELCLVAATGLMWYMISLSRSPGLMVEKLLFVCLFGSFAGMAAQFAVERFESLRRRRTLVYAFTVLVTGIYYLILAPVPAIDYGVGARTTVAVFSMFCLFLWLPSFADRFDFNSLALIHFKAAFTAILYALVLTIGLASIIAAVNTLLFKVDSDCYSYMSSAVWILFATTYYLSLLPQFNSDEAKEREYAERASSYPRFLEILISYIAIVLIAVYTGVLLTYFVKIAITRSWPSGRLGPMVLAYSAVGLLVYVLASRLTNRFAYWYQQLFPKVLIPVVVMQLVSVYIRLNAYGVTESRYYVALFGVFSLVIGAVLSVRPVRGNWLIALLAAGFALVSVVPPVDAFSLSRNSQLARLEGYLVVGGLLDGDILTPRADADHEVRVEVTNILQYLDRRGYTKSLAWLPDDFNLYRDMETVLGFDPTYPQRYDDKYTYGYVDSEASLDISGYDALLSVNAGRGWEQREKEVFKLSIREEHFELQVKHLSSREVRLSLHRPNQEELVTVNLHELALQAAKEADLGGGPLDPEQLTFDVQDGNYKLRIIFQHISLMTEPDNQTRGDYYLYVLVGIDDA